MGGHGDRGTSTFKQLPVFVKTREVEEPSRGCGRQLGERLIPAVLQCQAGFANPASPWRSGRNLGEKVGEIECINTLYYNAITMH